MWKLKRCRNIVGNLKRYSQAVSREVEFENISTDVKNLQPGTLVHGFRINSVEDVAVFNILALQLTHERTKAKYLHLYRNDSNNVFSINFRTTPKDSTGLPHILEHTVLCGSQLYPVRDPFFKMLNRSLATFMNAMTGSDYTIYPFSTQNLTDYRNLQKIYLDAVFRPKLSEFDFMQEGWRLEFEDPKDKKTDLIIKGVVYNEMKGVYSENENLLCQKLQNLILPDHTYSVVSGGDPLIIPSLTWEDLKQFHQDHYHPSNASFYSYGNFPLLPTLEYLNNEYLNNYHYKDTNHTLVTPQNRWNSPKKEQIVGRFENMREPFEKQNTCCISLVMTDILDVYETFLLQFITELLIRGPNSPMYKALIDTNFSGGFTSSTGYDTQQRDSIFTIGLQGLQKSDVNKVEVLFDKTVDEIIAKGFDQKHIESVLHSYELNIKHQTNNFGLAVLFGLTPVFNHNGNIIDALKVDELIVKLKMNLDKDNEYLRKVVKKYFKDNSHRLLLTMAPDKDYEIRQQQLEHKLIADKIKPLSAKDKEDIYVKGLQLLQQQSAHQDKNLLPSLEIDDINSDVEHVPLQKLKPGNVPTSIYSVNTNDITYFKGIISTNDLTPEQQLMLPLLCYVIPKMGTSTMNYREFDSLITRKTAGLDLSVHLADSLFQLHSYEPGVLLSSYCLDQNVETMWYLWNQIFSFLEFTNVDRFKTLLQLYMSNLTQGLVDSGHIYSMQAAGSLVSGSAYQRELLSGLHHITYMKSLMKNPQYESILKQLNDIAKILFDKNKLRCSLNVSPKNKDNVHSTFEIFASTLPGNTFGKPNENTFKTNKSLHTSSNINCQHHVLNVPVFYCSKAVLTVPYTDPDFAKLRVLARLLSSKYLHPELREKKGAYGGGARISPDGVFSFFSYRDPHSFQTLDVFDNSASWFQKELKSISNQDVLEAKLGVFQGLDAPIPPSDKGANDFVRGITPEILQRHRAEVMTVDMSGLQLVSEKYLGNTSKVASGKTILGPRKENEEVVKRADIDHFKYNMSINFFESSFVAVLSFLKDSQWIYNYPNTHILVNKVLDEFKPDWIRHLDCITNNELNDLPFGYINNNWPDSLQQFLRNILSLRCQIDMYKTKYEVPVLQSHDRLSVKKAHEIVRLAVVIHDLCQKHDISVIIDVGAGLGYLSYLLYEKYNYKILAIEGSEETYQLALKKQNEHHINTKECVKFIHHFITENSHNEIKTFLESTNWNIDKVCISGLHACADLSTTILDVFKKLDVAMAMAVMPCCYHRLEMSLNSEEEEKFLNFPKSKMLRDTYNKLHGQTFLRRPFLRLACQQTGSSWQCTTAEDHLIHSKNCTLRAILQEVAYEENLEIKRLKRKSKKIKDDVVEYIKNVKSTHKLIKSDGSDYVIDETEFATKMLKKWENYKDKCNLVEVLTAFQTALQSLCENIVLLDRVQYLRENGINGDIYKVTDDHISPRCHALVANK
ncbi:hypothetical protein FQR65_LT00411 [Abscondita terminalis]|nr:hypothetical protein FQR65_LT00411 [Abscondita terminalis]